MRDQRQLILTSSQWSYWYFCLFKYGSTSLRSKPSSSSETKFSRISKFPLTKSWTFSSSSILQPSVMKEILASSSLSTEALLDKYLVKYRRDLAFKAERCEEKSDLHKSMAPLSAILDLVLKPLSPRVKAHDRFGSHDFFGLYKEAVSRERNQAGIFKDGSSNGRGKVCRFYCFTLCQDDIWSLKSYILFGQPVIGL